MILSILVGGVVTAGLYTSTRSIRTYRSHCVEGQPSPVRAHAQNASAFVCSNRLHTAVYVVTKGPSNATFPQVMLGFGPGSGKSSSIHHRHMPKTQSFTSERARHLIDYRRCSTLPSSSLILSLSTLILPASVPSSSTSSANHGCVSASRAVMRFLGS